jgi:hypothetical protein
MRTLWQRCAMLALVPLGGCTSDSTAPDYDPMIDPANFVTSVTNPFFPLVPGARYGYRGGSETNTIEVLSTTRTVMGIQATIVHDLVFDDGSLIEETFDWFAEDRDGNVWYLGEDSREIENGRVVSTDGSWEAGVSGAKPGIIMWGDPSAHIGEEYRQEFARGEAEDWGKVIAVNRTVQVPFGTLTGCVQTEDWNALESRSGSLEHKYYCPQLGFALEVHVRSGDRLELVGKSP